MATTQHVITDEKPELVVIFGGDHVYKMDYSKMLEDLVQRGARLSVAVIDVTAGSPRNATRRLSRMR